MIRKQIFLLFCLFSLKTSAQPKIHFNFISHNEETPQWNGTPYYNANRLRLISISGYFQSHGITWNMQSDWRYLTSVLTKETAALMLSTNNKNILRWMYEDMGVEMDPHAHESQYIYPDVAKLLDSIGLPESKIMGGSIYNDSNGVNVWTNLVNGQYGLVFPNFFWQPDYMMGGGTPNHVADIKYYGFWNPQDTANYLVHDSSSHLRHIGVGCEIRIKDTISFSYIMSQVNDVVNAVQSGQYPSNGFYVQTIFFEQGDLNDTAFYNKVIAVADSVNAFVTAGAGQWSTLKQSYTEWETTYNAQVFQWECGQVFDKIIESSEDEISVYPVPSSGKIIVSLQSSLGQELEIYNQEGSLIFQKRVGNENELDLRGFPRGIYFYRISDQDGRSIAGKFILE